MYLVITPPGSVDESKSGARALGKARMTDMELARRIHVDYPMAAARAFDKVLSPGMTPGERFRFLYCSGALAERDEQKSLWVMPEYRRIRVCPGKTCMPWLMVLISSRVRSRTS